MLNFPIVQYNINKNRYLKSQMIAKTSEIDSTDAGIRKRKEQRQIFDRNYFFVLYLY